MIGQPFAGASPAGVNARTVQSLIAKSRTLPTSSGSEPPGWGGSLRISGVHGISCKPKLGSGTGPWHRSRSTYRVYRPVPHSKNRQIREAAAIHPRSIVRSTHLIEELNSGNNRRCKGRYLRHGGWRKKVSRSSMTQSIRLGVFTERRPVGRKDHVVGHARSAASSILHKSSTLPAHPPPATACQEDRSTTPILAPTSGTGSPIKRTLSTQLESEPSCLFRHAINLAAVALLHRRSVRHYPARGVMCMHPNQSTGRQTSAMTVSELLGFRRTWRSTAVDVSIQHAGP